MGEGWKGKEEYAILDSDFSGRQMLTLLYWNLVEIFVGWNIVAVCVLVFIIFHSWIDSQQY